MVEEVLAEPLAIVGMACRFPGGSDSLDAYWDLISAGRNVTRPVPRDRWDWRRFHDRSDGAGKSIAWAGHFLDRAIDRFDAGFFGISPREAAPLDPQQRLLLEVAWEAVEGAGLVMDRLRGGRVGVFVGAFGVDNQLVQMSRGGRYLAGSYTIAGCSAAMLANRVSYTFGFAGPSLTMDTACSSSLVAFHYACRSVWSGESEVALAAGVNLMFHPDFAIGLSKAHFLAPDGRSKSFDVSANGYGRGEGAGVVVLKRLSRALADGDPVEAIVRGTGVNQDGHTSGITLPSGEAQARLIAEVCRRAGVSPRAVGYLEAHGTGTPVGDPIEASAIGEAVGAGRPGDLRCHLGSVKANIGHLEAAAGIAGVIKAALCLKYRTIPPHPLVDGPNPAIPFDDLGLALAKAPTAWPGFFDRAIAGVNSFGFGGTNAHAILEEAPRSPYRARATVLLPPSQDPERTQLLVLSARSEPALQALARAHAEGSEPGPELVDLCYSAAVRSSHHPHRLAVVADSPGAMRQKLAAFATGASMEGVRLGTASARQGPVFVYSGMGPQWWGMGQTLLAEEPVFRREIERIDACFEPIAGWSLASELEAGEARSRVQLTEYAQPLNFAMQVGLTVLLESWGVTPRAVVGHSVGEVSAAYTSGMLCLEDAVRVSLERGRKQAQARGGGGMLAVGMSAHQARTRLRGRERLVVIAAVNSPGSCTLSGTMDALESIAAELEREQIFQRFLKVDIAYHSPQMEPLEQSLLDALAGIQPRQPRLPLYSTVTGGRVGSPWDAEYWYRNVRAPVLFADAITTLLAEGYDLFLEVGPHPVLSGSLLECVRESSAAATAVGTLRRGASNRASLLDALGALYTAGCTIDWRGLYGDRGRFVRLPAYPWQRELHWCESLESREDRLGGDGHPLLDLSERAPDPAWRAELGDSLFPYLRDHKIQGAVVFPGAGYVEACLAAAIELEGASAGPIVLESITFKKALVLDPAGGTQLHVALDPRTRKVTAHARPRGRETWDAHADARILERKGTSQPAPGNEPFDLDLDLEPEPARALYTRLAQRGLEYGPLFQAVRSITRGAGRMVAELELPDTLGDDLDRYHLHPVLLDAGFHALLAAVETSAEEQGLFLPVGIERVRFHAALPARVWCRGRLNVCNSTALECDLTFHDETGRLLAEVRGFRCKAIGKPSEAADPTARRLYDLTWRPAILEPSGRDQAATLLRAVVLTDAAGLGARLADLLSDRGWTAAVVERGPKRARLSADRFMIAGLADDHDWLFQELGRDARIDALVDLRALDLEPLPEAALDDAATGLNACSRVLTLIQALGRAGLAQTPRVWTATAGAIAVDHSDRAPVPNQAALWGLARVVEVEHSELRFSIVDLDPELETNLELLADEINAAGPETELAYRGKDRFAARLVQSNAAPRITRLADGAAPYELVLRSEGSFDNLAFHECERIEPGPGQVEVQIAASGLNYKDVLKVMGVLSADVVEGTWSGRTLGLECSGVITRVGPGVCESRIGEAVQGWAAGGFRRYLTAPSQQFSPLFPGLSLEEAAAAPVVFMTAYHALKEIAQLEPGESVLIHAASGGVGLAAIQVAQALGARIFATAGSPEKRAFVHALGVEHVFDSRSLDFAEQILKATAGRGVDVVLNSLTGDALRKSVEICAAHGRFIEIGKRDIDADAPLNLKPFNRNLTFAAIDLDRLLVDRPHVAARLENELRTLFASGALGPIPTTCFPAAQIEDAFRQLAQARHIGKLVVTHGEPVPVVVSRPRTLVRPDATYLVTGGLSGFGLETARWLISQGARTLVLVGRKGAATPEAREALEAFAQAGVCAHAAAVDVSDRGAVTTLVHKIRESMPPLAGVFHAAMVLDDDLIDRLDPTRFRTPLDPKAKGAWNLHLATRGLALDHFVLYSSLVGVIGNLGQGAYAAANAWLDALAEYRRSLGLPALTVNWGSLAGAGFVARNQGVSDHLERTGLVGLPIPEALVILGQLMAEGRTRAIAADIDWGIWRRFAPAVASRPKYTEITAKTENEAQDGSAPDVFARRVLAATHAERVAIAAAAVQEILARVLRMPAEKLDLEQNISQLGVDSLMAVELQALLSARTGATFSPMDFIGGGTILSLAERLLEKLSLASAPASTQARAGNPTATPAETPAPVRAPARRIALDSSIDAFPDVDDLSDAEVDELLNRLLSQEAHP